MKNLSMKKFSILGLLLVAASAVVAAVLPSKANKDAVRDQQGTLKASTGGGVNDKTCVVTNILGDNTCNVSDSTDTTTATGASNRSSTELPSPLEDSSSVAGGAAGSVANTAAI